jgi:hypothetical protein
MRTVDGIVLRCLTTVAAVGTFRTSTAICSAPAGDIEADTIETATGITIEIVIMIGMETAVMAPGAHTPRLARTLA